MSVEGPHAKATAAGGAGSRGAKRVLIVAFFLQKNKIAKCVLNGVLLKAIYSY